MDMDALMAQAAELQNKVSAAQEYLGKTVVKGVAGNGACIVDMTGKYDLVKMTVTPELLTHGADVVADVISVAYRDAKNKADELVDKVMGQATSGINMPN